MVDKGMVVTEVADLMVVEEKVVVLKVVDVVGGCRDRFC